MGLTDQKSLVPSYATIAMNVSAGIFLQGPHAAQRSLKCLWMLEMFASHSNFCYTCSLLVNAL